MTSPAIIAAAGPLTRVAARSATRNISNCMRGRFSGSRNYTAQAHTSNTATGHKPSGDLPWFLGAVAFTVPTVVWLTAGAKKKDHHEGVSLSDSTGHGKEIEDISSRAGEIAREAKDKAEHVTGADKGPISKEFAGNKFDDASKAVQGMGEKVEQRVGETYEEAKRRVEESMSTARDSVDSVKQKVGHAAEEARDMLPGAKKKVEEATEEASERVRESTPDSSKVKAAAEDGLERAESKVKEGVNTVKGQAQRFDTGDVEGKVKRGAADVEKRAKSLAADAEAKAREGADVARKAMVKGARDERTTKEQLVETQE